MRTVVVTEKPSVARALAPAARASFPDADLTLVSTLMLGAYRYAMPHGLTWSDFPAIHEPDRLVVRPHHQWMPLRVDAAGAAHPLVAEGRLLIQQAERLVFACDPDHTGVIGFDLSVKGAMGLPLYDRATLAGTASWRMVALDERSIRKSVTQAVPFSCLSDQLHYGETKRYIDHQFQINSWAILGRCLEMVGAPREPALSKYMVQMLYHVQRAVQNRALVTEGQLIVAMKNWQGTERYPMSRDVAIGSAASRSSIIEHLFDLGLLHRGPQPQRPVIRLTDRGQALLDLLHPGCEDRDLPFRLHAWCGAGLDVSRTAIDRYLRTWFGRQKRRLNQPVHGLT